MRAQPIRDQLTTHTTAPNLNWLANYIWGIADDVLRDVYVRGKYRDVILPMTVLRGLDAVLEPTKRAVLDMKATLDSAGVTNQDAALRQVAGQAFYNTSEFTLSDLRARAGRQQLRADFVDYLDGFSPNVQDILDNFEFRNQIPRLDRADALGSLIEKLTSPDINLGPDPVMDPDGAVRHPSLDNHGMGTVFEELIRRFNEENNEEAGEHFTPRDAVAVMAKLVFQPIADRIESDTYLLYDGACGTGGMLTVAEDELHRFAEERGKQVSTHLYGQEINAETYAICKADLLLKGEGESADNIVGGPEHSTLSNDAFPMREFDFMLSNPPYGKSRKTDLQRMGGKKGMSDHRFLIDVSRTVPVPPGVFVIWDGMGLVAKHIEHVPHSDPPMVVLGSLNPEYDSYERSVEEIHIVGQAIWVSRKLSGVWGLSAPVHPLRDAPRAGRALGLQPPRGTARPGSEWGLARAASSRRAGGLQRCPRDRRSHCRGSAGLEGGGRTDQGGLDPRRSPHPV